MKETILLISTLLFLIIILISLIRRNKKNSKPKLIAANSIPKTKVQQQKKPTINFVENKSTVGGIIACQIKKNKQKNNDESLKKPIGWIAANSYDDDVRDSSVEKYVPIQDEHQNKQKINKNNITILVVDDSVTVLKHIENILNKFNYEIITKKDGLAALDYLKMTTKFPDLIISDLEMPKMTGTELIQAIRDEKRFKRIPILVVSSNPEPCIYLLTDGSINGAIKKPFDKDDFTNQIKYLLNN
ncbi:response regulator [archaeon]|nr:response regulator [archaeon]